MTGDETHAGPPGTGKTVTSASIVYQLAKLGQGQVRLIASPNTGITQSQGYLQYAKNAWLDEQRWQTAASDASRWSCGSMCGFLLGPSPAATMPATKLTWLQNHAMSGHWSRDASNESSRSLQNVVHATSNIHVPSSQL